MKRMRDSKMKPFETSPSTVRRGRLALACVALLAVAGSACEKEEPEAPKKQQVTLNVRTVDLTDAPVENVRFYINGKKFGITDQDGTFKGRYDAKDGDTLMFNVEAPPGYSVPPTIDQSRWQYHVKYPADGRPLQINFTAQLQRPERQYLFMVRAEPAGTAVKVNNKVIGKTGANGNALLKVSGVPGSKFAAKAGAISLKGKFAEDDEVYLLTATKSGPLGGGNAGVAAAPPPAEPEPVAAEPEPVAAVPAEPEPAKPAPAEPEPEPEPEPVRVARAAPPPAEDPFEAVRPAAAPARSARRAPEPVFDNPPPSPRRAAPDPMDDLLEPEPVAAAPVPVPEPEPVPVEPEPVAAVIPMGGGDDLLLDDDPPAAAPVAVAPAIDDAPGVKRKRSEREAAAAQVGGLADDGEMVDARAATSKTTVASGGANVAGMSREEISSRLKQIQGGLKSSKVLARSDVDFLTQIDRTHPGYREANRLLADFYYQLKDYRRQIKALEVATKRGRYKHDGNVLLSLAKAYARRKNYGRALSTMRKVEAKMRNLPARSKADAYRFHAEILEFEFLRQYDADSKGANVALVDRAITKWERYKTFARGADAGGVAKAGKKIKELENLKSQVEL